MPNDADIVGDTAGQRFLTRKFRPSRDIRPVDVSEE